MHQDPAGGAANQGRDIGAVVGGGQRRLVRQADAIDEPHVHIDDLEALLVTAAAGDDLGFIIHMAGVPQAVGDQRRLTFGAGQLRCGRFADAGRQLMHHAVLYIQHAAQRPGQPGVQARAEHLYRFAETLIDSSALQRHFMHARQRPAYREHHQQHRQERAAHVGKRPNLAQVDAKAVMQFMLQRQQGLRWPAQQAGDKALRDQARFEARLARAEQRQHAAQQELQRHQRGQQADQHCQAQRPHRLGTGEQQANRADQQATDRHAAQLRQG
ncbi:hypothetical protein [Pseudomonas sp. 24 E 13]|nr:hypothetical protein [Pseudomonas sp. 24 E 13]